MNAPGGDLAALFLAIGLIFALVCYLFTNLSPGGMVSPAWLAFVLTQGAAHLVVALTVILVTYGAMLVLQREVILYGKRLFAVVVLTAIFLQVTVHLLLPGTFPLLVSNTTLGFVVPGLVAYQLVRQPLLPTLMATSAVTLLTYGVMGAGLGFRLIPST